ncbi:MAG: hypothetical protein EPO11_03485 [Gammaproteobacteria bacterium]|nr:MAG: hypothetical protein EPO11_03485 [Gammaproteobacteria bacterium]
MPKKSHEELLSELSKKQEALQNRIASIEAKKRKEEDRIFTRKKILIGAFLLEKFKNNPDELNNLVREMDNFLTRPHDRKLFGLPINSAQSLSGQSK